MTGSAPGGIATASPGSWPFLEHSECVVKLYRSGQADDLGHAHMHEAQLGTTPGHSLFDGCQAQVKRAFGRFSIRFMVFGITSEWLHMLVAGSQMYAL